MKKWVWDLRQRVSFLRAYGHPEAEFYTLGKVKDESRLTANVLNLQIASEAILTQLAVHSLFSKGAGEEFGKAVKRLTDG